MIPLSEQRLFDAVDATWPAARQFEYGPWVIRRGAGGGKRVSAATALGQVSEADIALAEKQMADLEQRPLFMLRREDAFLDQAFAGDLVVEVKDIIGKSIDLDNVKVTGDGSNISMDLRNGNGPEWENTIKTGIKPYPINNSGKVIKNRKKTLPIFVIALYFNCQPYTCNVRRL